MPGPTAGGVEQPGAPTPGTVTAPAPRPSATRGRADGAGQGKTDDEILAEALDEFGKKNKPAQRGGDGASGGEQSPQASSATGGNEAGEGGDPAAPRQRAGQPSGGTERTQVLNRELQEGLAEFDRAMLSEQEAITQRANAEGYAGALPEGDFVASANDPAADPPLQTAMLDDDPGGPTGALKVQGNISTRSRSEVPPDLVDASGDDIIARQLREAAMKEQDPELRKKLWDEYRKYKRGLK